MKETKVTYRIPIREVEGKNISMWEYVEIAEEGESDAAKIAERRWELAVAFGKKEGLPRREWNDLLDAYRDGVPVQNSDYEKLSKFQVEILKELDKSDARMNHDKFPFRRESQRPETNGGNEATGSEETRV